MEELLHGVLALALYIIIVAGTALTCRVLIRIPDELFRKWLHCIVLGFLLVFVFCYKTWWLAVLTIIGFALIIYPVLFFLERFRKFAEMTSERRHGELKESLLLVFGMFAVIISVCWGWLGDRYLVLASVYAWGFGDAAAALIGKKWGKHKMNLPFADKHKSWEGSTAMFLTSLVSVSIVLILRGGLSIAGYIIIPIITALVSTLAELCSKNGYDTAICPISAMAVLIPLVYLFGGIA